MGKRLRDYQAEGDAVLERLDGQTLPKSVKTEAQRFKTVHKGYVKACDGVDAAQAVRDAALDAVAADDALLDGAVEALAVEAVAAKLGTRQAPLAKFTRHSVSKLRSLAMKTEADEVLAMCAKLAKSGAPKNVGAAAAKCQKHAKAVKAGLAKLVKPQAAYAKAREQRDALLSDWTRAYARLKKVAAAAWVDDEPTFKAVFAPLAAVHAPKTKRTKKAKTQPESPADA